MLACLAEQAVEALWEEASWCHGVAEVHNCQHFTRATCESDGVLVSWHNLCSIGGRSAVGLEDGVCCTMCVKLEHQTENATEVSCAGKPVNFGQQHCIVKSKHVETHMQRAFMLTFVGQAADIIISHVCKAV
jgi:hypothetical protein